MVQRIRAVFYVCNKSGPPSYARGCDSSKEQEAIRPPVLCTTHYVCCTVLRLPLANVARCTGPELS